MNAHTTAATTTLAILAVAQHAANYDLSINGIDAPIGDKAVRVSVPSTNLDAWLDSIVVDQDPVVRSAPVAGYESVVYGGHLASPIGDVRVTISTARRVVPLRVVGNAS